MRSIPRTTTTTVSCVHTKRITKERKERPFHSLLMRSMWMLLLFIYKHQTSTSSIALNNVCNMRKLWNRDCIFKKNAMHIIDSSRRHWTTKVNWSHHERRLLGIIREREKGYCTWTSFADGQFLFCAKAVSQFPASVNPVCIKEG